MLSILLRHRLCSPGRTPIAQKLHRLLKHLTSTILTGPFFRNAVDQFIQLNTSTLSTNDASEILSRCETVFLKDEGTDVSVWAFQFLLTTSDSTELRCFEVGDSAITRMPQHEEVEQFSLTLDIDPGEKYTVKACAVVLVFASGALVDFKLGPLSNEVSFQAKDRIPGGPVVDLSVQAREDDRVGS